MNEENIEESLSALMDGELPRADAQRAIDRVLADTQLRARWRRDHLIRAALTSQHSLLVADDDLAARVNTALAGDVVPLRRPARRSSWHIGLAAAASVATVAVLVMLNLSNAPPGAPLAPPSDSSPATTPGVPRIATAPVIAAQGAKVVPSEPAAGVASPADSALTRMTWNDAGPAVEERLNGYLLDHNEYLADGVRGMLPYARVVGYDARN